MKIKIITVLGLQTNNLAIIKIELSKDNKIICAEKFEFSSNDEMLEILINLERKYKISKTQLIISIPSHEIFLRKIIMPPADYDQISNMLKFETEKYLAFPAKDIITSFVPITEISESSQNEIFLTAVKNETINNYIQILNKAKLFPYQITTASLGILNIIDHINNNKNTVAFLNIFDNAWEINIFIDNKLVLSRGIKFPLNDTPNESFIKEFKNSIKMFVSSNLDYKIETIYYTAVNSEIISTLKKDFNFIAVDINLLSNFISYENIQSSILNNNFGLIGLAFSNKYNLPNLLPNEIQQKHLQKQHKKTILNILISVIGFIIIIISLTALIKYKQNSKYTDIINQIKKNKSELLELKKTNNKLSIIHNFKKNNLLVLNILKYISINLPNDVYIREYEYDSNQNLVRIIGRASSYSTYSKVISKLEELSYFSKIENKGGHVIKINDKNLVDFEITGVLKNEKTK
jgi:hypothetical protein